MTTAIAIKTPKGVVSGPYYQVTSYVLEVVGLSMWRY